MGRTGDNDDFLRKENPWFARVRYAPLWGKIFRRANSQASGPSTSSQTPANNTHPTSVMHSSLNQFLHHVFWHFVAPALATTAVLTFLRPPEYPVFPGITSPASTVGIKVQRAPDDAAARSLLSQQAPDLQSLYEAWNSYGGVFEYGRKKHPGVKYVPLPREHDEIDFRNLEYGGLRGLNLYIANIPSSWDEDKLDAYLNKWANDCNIRKEWIREFSKFRPKWWKREINECHPDGTCVLVSFGCRANTFDAVNK